MAEAWRALDAGPLAQLARAAERGEPVVLTLAGERKRLGLLVCLRAESRATPAGLIDWVEFDRAKAESLSAGGQLVFVAQPVLQRHHHRARDAGAQHLVGAVLEHPQQLHLGAQVHLADLVEEDGAAVGL